MLDIDRERNSLYIIFKIFELMNDNISFLLKKIIRCSYKNTRLF